MINETNLAENIKLINHAAELGREGFYTGLKAPAQDVKCLEMLKGRHVGDTVGLAILDSWLSAWHYEQWTSTRGKVE